MVFALRDDTSRHDAGRSLYGRSKARLPTGPASWPTRQGTSPIMVLKARVDAVCSQRAGPPGQLTTRSYQTPAEGTGWTLVAPNELARLASLQPVATRRLPRVQD